MAAISISRYMDEQVEFYRQSGNESLKKKLASTKARFLKSNRDIALSRLDQKDIEKWVRDMEQEGIQASSIDFYVRCLRAIYNKALKSGVINSTKNPFGSIPMYKTSKRDDQREETKVRKQDWMHFVAACTAMQGLLASPDGNKEPEQVARYAKACADALMAELIEQPPR